MLKYLALFLISTSLWCESRMLSHPDLPIKWHVDYPNANEYMFWIRTHGFSAHYFLPDYRITFTKIIHNSPNNTQLAMAESTYRHIGDPDTNPQVIFNSTVGQDRHLYLIFNDNEPKYIIIGKSGEYDYIASIQESLTANNPRNGKLPQEIIDIFCNYYEEMR